MLQSVRLGYYTSKIWSERSRRNPGPFFGVTVYVHINEEMFSDLMKKRQYMYVQVVHDGISTDGEKHQEKVEERDHESVGDVKKIFEKAISSEKRTMERWKVNLVYVGIDLVLHYSGGIPSTKVSIWENTSVPPHFLRASLYVTKVLKKILKRYIAEADFLNLFREISVSEWTQPVSCGSISLDDLNALPSNHLRCFQKMVSIFQDAKYQFLRSTCGGEKKKVARSICETDSRYEK